MTITRIWTDMMPDDRRMTITRIWTDMMPWWQTNDDFVCHQGIMSVQIIVIIIRLSSRHHVCSDPCYHHSSVIKASCLLTWCLDDRQMTITRIWTDMMPWWQTNDDNKDLNRHDALMTDEWVIRLSSRHHVCSDPCYRHSSVIKASCLFRSLLSSFVCHQGIMFRRMTITRIWTDMMPWWQTNDDNNDLNRLDALWKTNKSNSCSWVFFYLG
jgi:hypothetical protein